jgi:hypothetical protein
MRRVGRGFAGGLLSVVAVLALTAPAAADEPTLRGVEITGVPVVGSTLTAVIAGTVDPSRVTYSWCHQGDGARKCAQVLGSGPAYVPVAADVGHTLLVKAAARIEDDDDGDDDDDDEDDEKVVTSRPSAQVTAAPSPPPDPTPDTPPDPTPDTPPDPTPDRTPDPTPTRDATAPASTFASAGEPRVTPVLLGGIGSTVAAAVPLQFVAPFPVVRIRGSVAARGALISMLKVTAARNVNVYVRCEGSRCPIRRHARAPGRIRALERYLSAGTRITIRVRRSGYVGKYVRIVIRAGRVPYRRDACVVPGSSRPVSCKPT